MTSTSGDEVASPGDSNQARRTATNERIAAFGAVVGDDNPLHLDEAYASEGLFDGPVAHGMFSAGVISNALAGLSGDIVYVSQNLDFEAPVYPGQTVTATVEVVESLGDGRLRVETTAETEETTVVTGEAVVLSLEH